MAKQKINLRDTLHRNKAVPSAELPSKLPLPKSTKDLAQINQQVDRIHQTPTDDDDLSSEFAPPQTTTTTAHGAATDLPLVMVLTPPPVTTAALPAHDDTAAHDDNDDAHTHAHDETPQRPISHKLLDDTSRLVRISLDTPKELHLQLKIKAAKNGLSIRDYILGLLITDLSK